VGLLVSQQGVPCDLQDDISSHTCSTCSTREQLLVRRSDEHIQCGNNRSLAVTVPLPVSIGSHFGAVCSVDFCRKARLLPREPSFDGSSRYLLLSPVPTLPNMSKIEEWCSLWDVSMLVPEHPEVQTDNNICFQRLQRRVLHACTSYLNNQTTTHFFSVRHSANRWRWAPNNYTPHQLWGRQTYPAQLVRVMLTTTLCTKDASPFFEMRPMSMQYGCRISFFTE
jgi:hypothetical protein